MPRTHSHAEIAALARSRGLSAGAAEGMAHVAECESGGDAGIVHQNTNGTTDTGLWQINSVHTRDHPSWTVAWLKVPANNAAAMKTLYDSSRGVEHWKASMGCWLPKISSNALGSTLRDPLGVLGAAVSDPGGVVSGVADALNPLDDIAALAEPFVEFVGWLTDPNTWKRAALVIAGGGIVLVGVAVVARGTEVGQTVESAAKTAATRGAAK